jgi:endonuclease-3 related protein
MSMAGRRGFDSGGYHPGGFSFPRTPAQRFEIAVGAVLTQNTSWGNVQKALAALFSASEVPVPRDLLDCSVERLAGLVRSSGYHNQKARTLLVLSEFFQAPASLRASSPPARDALLSLRGIGEETADSILLYAFGQPVFVVDAYTRRLLQRIGLIGGRERYQEIQALFHEALPQDHELFNEYHALIVAHAKARCRAQPACEGCPVPRCRSRT